MIGILEGIPQAPSQLPPDAAFTGARKPDEDDQLVQGQVGLELFLTVIAEVASAPTESTTEMVTVTSLLTQRFPLLPVETVTVLPLAKAARSDGSLLNA